MRSGRSATARYPEAIQRDLYQAPSGRFALVDDGNSELPATPGFSSAARSRPLDVRWIAPAYAASMATVLLTLLAWPVAALWRRWRKRRWSEDSGDRRSFLAARLVLLVDAAVIGATAVLFAMSSDFTIFSDALDPLLLVLYALAWLGVVGAIVALWAAILFWRKGAGSRWSRVHHSLIAAACVMIAWFFVAFHIAGTTLNY